MKASAFWSCTSLSPGLIFLAYFSCLFLFSCSKDEDDAAAPVLTSYAFPPEILDSIFAGDPDLSNSIRNVDDLLNELVQNGMSVYEGSNPPEIYTRHGANTVGVKFNIDNELIYDNKAPANVDSVYGKYEETIRIIKNQQNSFVAEASYISVEDVNYPEFRGGLDRGSGTGFVSGSGNNFTVFYKVDDGVFDDIGYKALWIISGTVSDPPHAREVSNVTKCLVMLQKGPDPTDKVANPGTIRIFRDADPRWIQPEVVITGLTPESAFAGARITITGSGFSATAGENTVLFGTLPAAVQSATTTQLTVIAPAGPQGGGTVPVTVRVGAKTSNSSPFIYPRPDVVISDIKGEGCIGEFITIIGSGFSAKPDENTVLFREVSGTEEIPAKVLAASPTQLRVQVPVVPANQNKLPVKVLVSVQVANKSTTAGIVFDYFGLCEG